MADDTMQTEAEIVVSAGNTIRSMEWRKERGGQAQFVIAGWEATDSEVLVYAERVADLLSPDGMGQLNGVALFLRITNESTYTSRRYSTYHLFNRLR